MRFLAPVSKTRRDRADVLAVEHVEAAHLREPRLELLWDEAVGEARGGAVQVVVRGVAVPGLGVVEVVVGLDVVDVVEAHVGVQERRAHLEQALRVALELVLGARQQPTCAIRWGRQVNTRIQSRIQG